MVEISPEDKRNNEAGPQEGHPQGDAPTQDVHFLLYRPHEGRGIPLRVPWDFLLILLCGLIFELLYVVIVALAPLPGLHMSATPLAGAWPWTLAPSHILFAGIWASATSGTSLAPGWAQLVLLGAALLAVIGVYALAVWSALRNKGEASMRWLLLLIAGALLFGLTLLFQPALFANDVFNYIFSGRILSVYHMDPLNSVPIQFLSDPYLRWLGSGRYTPTIYGPLSLFIASLLVSIGHGPVATLLLFKGMALLSHLVNCVLVWAILGKIAPARRLLGTLLYAWNPLATIELAGNGHNEGILLSILLLATLLYVQGKGRWRETGALVLFGLAISMNLIVLLIAPLFTWFVVRTEGNILRILWSFCWRSAIELALVISLYLPFWRGASTFFALTSSIEMRFYVHSPVGLLTEPLRWLFGLVAQGAHFPPVMQPIVSADVTLRASAIFIFALIYIQLFGKVRRATTSTAGMRYGPGSDQEMIIPGLDVLLDSWSFAVFWYLVLVVSAFWPWYVLLTLWVGALRRLDTVTISLLLLAGTALLSYPLLDLAGSAFATYQPLLIFGIPLVYLLVGRMRPKERRSFV